MEERQAVAGRMQARESNVEEMKMAQRLHWLWRELEKARTAHEARQAERAATGLQPVDFAPDKGALLTATYLKTGVPETADLVFSLCLPCFPLPSPLSCGSVGCRCVTAQPCQLPNSALQSCIVFMMHVA